MYRYTVMFVSTAVLFAVLFLVLDLLFADSRDWKGLLLQALCFGAIMTGVQYYKERKKHK